MPSLNDDAKDQPRYDNPYDPFASRDRLPPDYPALNEQEAYSDQEYKRQDPSSSESLLGKSILWGMVSLLLIAMIVVVLVSRW